MKLYIYRPPLQTGYIPAKRDIRKYRIYPSRQEHIYLIYVLILRCLSYSDLGTGFASAGISDPFSPANIAIRLVRIA